MSINLQANDQKKQQQLQLYFLVTEQSNKYVMQHLDLAKTQQQPTPQQAQEFELKIEEKIQQTTKAFNAESGYANPKEAQPQNTPSKNPSNDPSNDSSNTSAGTNYTSSPTPTPQPQPDYYKMLGVNNDATSYEIKKAYHKESLQNHPDKGGDMAKQQDLNEAHGILGDTDKKDQYDMSVAQYNRDNNITDSAASSSSTPTLTPTSTTP